MSKYESLKCWSFAWLSGKPTPCITRISAYCRSDLIAIAEKEMAMNWKKIYRRGGRAIKTVIKER